MEITARLLEVKTGEFEGNKYASVVVRYNEKLLEIKLEKDLVSKVDQIKERIDQDVNLELTLDSSFSSLRAQVRVASVG